MHRFFLIVGTTFLFSMGTANASDNLVVIKVRLDQTMNPLSATQAFEDCTKNPVCKTVIDGAAAYVGTDSSYVTTAIAAVTASRQGEESNFDYKLPAGYQYCRAKLETISVVPNAGDRASAMSVRGNERSLGVYTWTPRLGLGQGRSWIEADFTLVGVKDEMVGKYRDSGQCKSQYLIVDCRGGSGINKGAPACGVSSD